MPAVLITGANRGLGLEFAHQYLADDWLVLAACRNPAGVTNSRLWLKTPAASSPS
jgi:NAD(P)-dependent dehydrogenase (short-subunit alcohol dehydrogenase family)